MSAELYFASGPDGNNARLQGTTVGGSKPLHRFIRGQPKTIGIILLVLGSSFFILSIAISTEHMWTVIPPSILLGALVTISLALSIVTILGTFWSVMHSLPSVVHNYRHYSYFAEDNDTDIEEAQWASYYEAMGVTVESIFLFYSFVGGIIFIVMSALAGAALRSTKNQAIVVMTASPNETPVE
ncbi:uncharacterized protein LOC119890340 isoform X3 [Micropterus salmoides]|uniref:uncharacterized protein LOC119890340 isoform X3 n=1 Tax=Micropterus salmoides TaxID=27706 RepID=UPI0018EE3AA8|nr:uncharacterized protein LOC119890340 isoform X3 [Micropterus salmoides]